MKLLCLLLLLPFLAFGYPLTPNPATSPGKLCSDKDREFSYYRYAAKIPYCERDVSTRFKKRIYAQYGIPENERHNYTIDHIIPLSIGGSNHASNLWPEHKDVKAMRPDIEQEVADAIAAGEITQAEAVAKILEAKFHPVKQRAANCAQVLR